MIVAVLRLLPEYGLKLRANVGEPLSAANSSDPVPLEAVPVVWTVAEHPLTTRAAASPTPSAVARRRGTRREPFVMASFSFVSSSSRERREALLRRPSCSALRVLAMYAHTSTCATRDRPHGPGRPRWWGTSGTS